MVESGEELAIEARQDGHGDGEALVLERRQEVHGDGESKRIDRRGEGGFLLVRRSPYRVSTLLAFCSSRGRAPGIVSRWRMNDRVR